MRIGRIITCALLVACSSGEIVSVSGPQSQTLSLDAGQELDVTLRTIGLGQYDSLPLISSASVRFLDMSFVSPGVPAGPTQRFRFRAEAWGQAVVTFHHTDQNPTVEDTVSVR